MRIGLFGSREPADGAKPASFSLGVQARMTGEEALKLLDRAWQKLKALVNRP